MGCRFSEVEIGTSVTVFAPATVANVACGYDVLGFALDAPGDEIVARRVEGTGLRIGAVSGDGGKLPKVVEKNTAGVAALDLMRHLGCEGLGMELEIHKKMPFGSGLGSSAASSVGGVFAVNELLGSPLSRRELLPFAMQGEVMADGAWHADNIAPSLLGGMVLIRDNDELDVISLPVPEGLWAAVVHPEVEILTADARAILPKEIALTEVTRQVGNLGALVSALYTSDFALLGRSLQDAVAEPYRKKLIPGFEQARAAAEKGGALGYSISGAGPSVFALCKGRDRAAAVGELMRAAFLAEDVQATLYHSAVNDAGVKVIRNRQD